MYNNDYAYTHTTSFTPLGERSFHRHILPFRVLLISEEGCGKPKMPIIPASHHCKVNGRLGVGVTLRATTGELIAFTFRAVEPIFIFIRNSAPASVSTFSACLLAAV